MYSEILQMPKKVLTARVLGIVSIINFVLFFFFLAFPYYYLLEPENYVSKTNPAWGFFMPVSSQAWFFFILAFVFLILAAIAICLLIWKRPDITLRGYHPI
jgi:hypothetical protein